MNDIERRVAVAGLKIERRADSTAARLVGHAAVFDTLSLNLGGYREQIKPGAFQKSIDAGDDVRALFNHDPNFVLGRSASKTLSLAEDSEGLAVDIDLPDTQTIRDLVIAPIERGDISQMSFGFQVMPGGQDWAENEDGVLIRTLSELKLFDVSPVTFPAYPATDVALRAMQAFRDSRRARPAMNLIRARTLLAGAL